MHVFQARRMKWKRQYQKNAVYVSFARTESWGPPLPARQSEKYVSFLASLKREGEWKSVSE